MTPSSGVELFQGFFVGVTSYLTTMTVVMRMMALVLGTKGPVLRTMALVMGTTALVLRG